ncbi:hypothetical protein K501DRAFT_194791, partial [Backusella circina FSU 941]
FLMKLWNNQTLPMPWNPSEKYFYFTIATILTDYWRLLKRFDFNQKHERAFEVLCVSPLFKHFSTMSKGIIYSW